jgi:hypothetical protein
MDLHRRSPDAISVCDGFETRGCVWHGMALCIHSRPLKSYIYLAVLVAMNTCNDPSMFHGIVRKREWNYRCWQSSKVQTSRSASVLHWKLAMLRELEGKSPMETLHIFKLL